MAETTTEAAEDLLLSASPSYPAVNVLTNAESEENEVAVTPSIPFNLPGVVPNETGGVDEAGGMTGGRDDVLDVPEKLLWDSSVWDTEGNTLDLPIGDLRFDPRCQLEDEEGLVVETLQVLLAVFFSGRRSLEKRFPSICYGKLFPEEVPQGLQVLVEVAGVLIYMCTVTILVRTAGVY